MNKFRSAILSGNGLRGGNPLQTDKQGRGAAEDDLTSVGIERHETRSADHRDGDRHRLAAETVEVTIDGSTTPAELVNLSGGGAMIRADLSPRLWQRVDLHLGSGTPLECAVRWIRGDRIGLEFAHETRIEASAEVRDATLLEVIRRTFPDVGCDIPADQIRAAPAAEPASDASRRGDRRHPLIWSGQILCNHDEHGVRLRNISASGALVECVDTLPEGVEVMLDLGQGVQQFATVAWCRGNQAGLIFATPFDVSRLAEAKPEVAPQRWVRPGFLDAQQTVDSPWAEQWDRATLEDLRDDLEGFLKR